MNYNDLTNPRKNLINGKTEKVTTKPYAFRVNKSAELIDTNSGESAEFNNLLAQYKAKVLEQYAFLYKS